MVNPARLLIVSLAFAAFSAAAAAPSAVSEQCREFLVHGLPTKKGDLLCRTGYALIHDNDTKAATWVAQRMTTARLATVVKRQDRFIPDPDIPKGSRAELDDYRGSGYDRGHMAPAADMRWSAQAMRESFYLSNMAPQVGVGLNRGLWSDLESMIRR